ncbi:MAG TPA: hypothetical protein VG267_19425 [Terracidiphilus sp.]|jgi:hypothetical protein|nr:hypothetical protein [Terracidiphilus sp.]
MKPWLIRIAALAVFAGSFALPAIRMAGSGPGNQPLRGWMCASFASILGPKALVQSLSHGVQSEGILISAGGLVNYLFLALLVLALWRRLVRTRLVIGALMLPCFIATWILFASTKTTPLIGHFLWIAGAVLLVVPDIVSLFRKRETAAIAPSASSEQA